MCPRSRDPFYKVTYYINWVTPSWTHSICNIPNIFIELDFEIMLTPEVNWHWQSPMSHKAIVHNCQHILDRQCVKVNTIAFRAR